MRLVDADALKQEFAKYFNGTSIPIRTMLIHTSTVFNMIDFAPTIDQAKHGHWISYLGEGCNLKKCSCCGHEYCDYVECDTYCGNCGAKMDGKDMPT